MLVHGHVPEEGTRFPSAGRRVRRPSRRGRITAAALDLAARRPAETITIAAIAAAAGMTPPAVYYHYPSKEAVLLDGFQKLGTGYLGAVERAAGRARLTGRMGQIATEVLAWAEETPHACAYFLAGPNLTPAVSALLHENRVEAVTLLHQAMLRAPGRPAAAEAGVLGVALLSLLETAITARCEGDRSVRGLGRANFADEVASIIEVIVGGVTW
jgi:AcrR family transcriptional regulator